MPPLNKLRRYMLSVTKDFSGSDKRQVPADASLVAFRQGATVKTITSINVGQTVTVDVYDAGRLRVGDQVHKGLDGATFLNITEISDRRHLKLAHASGPNVTLNVGDRLVLVMSITVYNESTGTATPITNTVTQPSTGILNPTYSKERFFDAAVVSNDGGFSARLLIDQPSGHSLREFDIRDFGGDIQAVLDLVAEFSDEEEMLPGGIVYIPRGDWWIDVPLKVRGGQVIIQGEGWATRIRTTNPNINILELEGDNTQGKAVLNFGLRDIQLRGPGTGTGNGISCVGSSSYRPPTLRFDNVFLFNMGGAGVRLEVCDFPLFTNVSFLGNGTGVFLLSVAQAAFMHCYANSNKGYGLYAEASDVYWQGIGLENNAMNSGLTLETGAQMWLKNCTSCVICRTDIEGFVSSNPAKPKTGIVIESSRGVVISGCSFLPGTAGPDDPDAVGVRIEKTVSPPGAKRSCGIQVVGNDFFGLGTGVKVKDASSCVDVYLGQNCAAGTGSNPGFRMYDYPSGVSASGLRIVVSGAMEKDDDISAGQNGFLLPVVGGTTFPTPGPRNDGMVAYHAGAPRGHQLKLSDGSAWTAIGSPEPAVLAAIPNPALFAGGSFLWVSDDALSRRLRSNTGSEWRPVLAPEAFTIANRPSPGSYGVGAFIWVSNETAGRNLQVSLGTEWRIVSTTPL